MGSTTESPETEVEHWVICGVCKQPNPAGALHCQHCWGASLYSLLPVTTEELAEIQQQNHLRARRRRLTKIVSVSILAPLMLFGAVFLSIYSFTDLVLPPSPTLNSTSSPGEWAMFRYDLGRSGSIGPTAIQPQGNLKWSFTTDAEIHSSPTVVDGTVYFGSRDFHLYALDAETGAERWRYKTRTWIDTSPAVVDGIVYFGSNDGYLYALDAATGEMLWKFHTTYPITSSPAVADGMVFFGSTDYSIYGLDAKTGRKIWSHRTAGWVTSSPAVDSGIVYVGSMDGSLYALQADNGRFRLKFRAREVSSSPAVKNGVVYFNSRSNLWAVDGKARNWPGEHGLRGWWLQFWAFRLLPKPPPISGFLWTLPLGRASSSSPVLTEDTIYTTSDNRLYSISIDERGIGWVFWAGGTLKSSPALSNGILYIGSEDSLLYAVDATSGQELWHFRTGDKITSSPTLVNGVVYVTSRDGKLYAIK